MYDVLAKQDIHGFVIIKRENVRNTNDVSADAEPRKTRNQSQIDRGKRVEYQRKDVWKHIKTSAQQDHKNQSNNVTPNIYNIYEV